MAAIAKLIEKHKTSPAACPNGKVTLVDGPFEGLELPHFSPKANAFYVTHQLIDTYLITHPHLDHICGFVVNTAALSNARIKVLAGLEPTIEAFKTHIFNNIIWPNLTDENSGVGLVTYRRLVEGGSPALGDDDEGKGYVEICEGLSVKTWSVSHGHCLEQHSHRGSEPNLDWNAQLNLNPMAPRSRSGSLRRVDSSTTYQERVCVNDSSAYFIRDIATGKEVLIFGDVEPDSISLSPRNRRVWQEAAPKVISRHLGAIFVECSYDNSQSDDRLFGHLKPTYLMEEMTALANEVWLLKGLSIDETEHRKRKRQHSSHLSLYPRRKSTRSPSKYEPMMSPGGTRFNDLIEGGGDMSAGSASMDAEMAVSMFGDKSLPLKGLKVVIIHVKDRLADGPGIGETVLKELRAFDKKVKLGCEFMISWSGQSVYL